MSRREIDGFIPGSSRLKPVLLNITGRQKSSDNHSPYLNPLSAFIVCPHTKRGNGMQEIKHARSLRIGRSSQPGNAYLVTCVVKDRLPIFSYFQRGRVVVKEMKRLHDSGVVRSLAWVVMPDHLHWLFELKSGSLPALMQAVKGRSAFAINKTCGAKTLTWQKGYHDHGVRAEEDLIEMARYVVNNPTRAGLVIQRGDYALWDCEWMLE